MTSVLERSTSTRRMLTWTLVAVALAMVAVSAVPWIISQLSHQDPHPPQQAVGAKQ